MKKTSWASDAIHPLAAEADIFHIAIGSAIIERTKPGRTVRFTLDAKQEERHLAEYLSRFHRIAVYNMDNGYGNNWAEIIQDNFQDKIVAALAYDPQMDDFGPDLAKIKKQNPDVVVLLSAGNAARIAQQARKMGIEAQLVGTRPGFFGSVISQKVSNFPVEMVVMQKDGRLIYDINEEEIGKNLFTAQMYSDYPSLLRVGRKMAQSPRGSGRYLFLDKKMETNVEKQMLWDTAGLHGTEFRLALARVINDFK